MGDIINTVKSSSSKATKNEAIDEKGVFSSTLLSTLCATFLQNVLVEKGNFRANE